MANNSAPSYIHAGRAGAPLRRTANLSDASPNRLVVGHSAVAQNLGVASAELDAAVLGNDGFVLWQSSDRTFTNCAGTCVALTGAAPSFRAGKRGALYAVYELLQLGGVRFCPGRPGLLVS